MKSNGRGSSNFLLIGTRESVFKLQFAWALAASSSRGFSSILCGLSWLPSTYR